MVLIGKYALCTHEKQISVGIIRFQLVYTFCCKQEQKGIYALGVHTVKNFFHT